ncbi:hypothetical protein KM043_012651 [Ampulex compressa]|nr:hypothetical protein KM043_012651 [Ampulex compressa]
MRRSLEKPAWIEGKSRVFHWSSRLKRASSSDKGSSRGGIGRKLRVRCEGGTRYSGSKVGRPGGDSKAGESQPIAKVRQGTRLGVPRRRLSEAVCSGRAKRKGLGKSVLLVERVLARSGHAWKRRGYRRSGRRERVEA